MALCKDCQKTRRGNEFKRRTERLWLKWLGDKRASKLIFEKEKEKLYATLAARNQTRGERLVAAERLSEIYDSEKSRFERLEIELGKVS